MPLRSLTSILSLSESFSFCCSPSCFVYLEVYVTPTYGKMFKSNIHPLLDARQIGWSSFIWQEEARSKMAKHQMAGSDGGLDVPNRLYQLATHL